MSLVQYFSIKAHQKFHSKAMVTFKIKWDKLYCTQHIFKKNDTINPQFKTTYTHTQGR